MKRDSDGVFVLREAGEDVWMVEYAGRVCTPTWKERGPAHAYLTALQAGTRKPEYRNA